MLRAPGFRFLACAALLALPGAPAALAQCTYNALSASTPVSTGAATTLYTFTSPGGSWGAIGVRSAAGSEHDLAAYAQTAASPTCVQNQVGSSALSGVVDFVIGDFRAGRNAPGPWYAKVNRSSGSGTALVEWDPGASELVVDDVPVVRNTDQVVDVYQVFLEAGVTYVISFAPSAGVDAKVLLFRNPGSGAFWASRSGALLTATGTVSYQAPASDEYALVVVNDDGGLSTYSLAVDQCQPPVTLASGSPVSTGPPLRYVIPQSVPYWSACGVRGSGADDWDAIAYRTSHGHLEPECFTDTIAVSSLRGPGVDFVVGDFNWNPVASYYMRVVQFAGSQAGVVEWDDGPDEIAVGAGPLARSTGPANVLECWDVSMNAGQTYSIYFARSGSADARWFVFENALQSSTVPYWAGRAAAAQSGTTSADYVPTTSGFHGIVVVNDNGATGNYQLAVYGANTGVGDGAAAALAPGIEAIEPNPVLGRTSVRYRLTKPARVAFDLLDVRGRLVTRMAGFDAPAGPGSFTWETRDAGRRLPSGIYFVRLDVDDSLLSIRKMILLP